MRHRCKKCKGDKTVKEKNRHEVVIEPGMADKQRIILAGAGDEEVRRRIFPQTRASHIHSRVHPLAM